MLYLPVFCLVALLGCQSAWAVQTEWDGVYTDPVYGGSIYVCVSEVGGVYYGQATFSLVGYMRGQIDVNNVFTGSYWTQGWEGLQGTFSLTLTGTSYTGTFTQSPGVTYTVSGTQTSSTTPADDECSRSDDYLLTSTDEHDSTGSYQSFGEAGIRLADMGPDDTCTSSFEYVYTDGTTVFGTEIMKRHLYGQVLTGRWMETGNYEGVNMYVAKNATHHYTFWWFFSRIGDFDWALTTEPDMEGHGLFGMDNSVLMASMPADENVCFAQWTVDAEQDCLRLVNVDSDDDASTTDVVTMTFAILSFVSIIVFGVLILMKVGGATPAMSDNSSKL